ncbi:MAG: extracellular solute-binding protein [Bacilli bacterium]|nr:extracellular solute-binding protein [Bacilli bacterium]
MKKILTYLIVFLSALAILSTSLNIRADEDFGGRTLTIYNVEDYISNGEDGYVDIIADFEEKYNVKVNYYTYDTNETMYNQFNLQKEGTYDLVCSSEYMLQKMIKEELVVPFENVEANIPNYHKYASKALREKFKGMEVTYKGETVNLDQFVVGYMWGTVGIIYDPECSDTIQEDVKSWDVFWNPEYKDLISIKNSLRDAFIPGLFHYYSQDEAFQTLMKAYQEDPTEENCKAYNALLQDIFDFKLDGSEASENENYAKIAHVKDELISMRGNIFGFEVDSGKNDIITGKIKLNLAYSGDAVFSIDTARNEADKYLEFYIPEDGSNNWYDGWVIPKGAKNVDLAYKFLDYLSDPENAANNMDYIGYTPFIVGDALFTLTGKWYGACDYDVNAEYLVEDEAYVIYNDELFEIIKDKPAELEVYPDNTEYFSSLEYDEEETYTSGDMVSYNGKYYNYINENDGNGDILNEDFFEEIEGYDLSYLFEGSLTEGRRAIIYAYDGSQNELETQYPSQEILARCAIMNDFGVYNDQVVIMWSQVKAYTNMTPVYVFLSVVAVLLIGFAVFYVVRKRIITNYKKKLVK